MKKKNAERKRRMERFCFFAGIIGCLGVLVALAVVIVVGWSKVPTRVSIDAGFGFEMTLNKKQEVQKVTPAGSDAEDAWENLAYDPKGDLIYDALETISEVLLEQADPSSPAELLITVEDDNTERADLLADYIKTDLEFFYQEKGNEITLLIRKIAVDRSLSKTAKKEGMTFGKASLMKKITDVNATLHSTDLQRLTVGELYALMNAGSEGLPVGLKAAEQAVAEFALAERPALKDRLVMTAACAFDEADAVYTVKTNLSSLVEGWTADDFTVDAFTGKVIIGTAVPADGTRSEGEDAADRAKQTALAAAGLAEEAVTGLQAEPVEGSEGGTYRVTFRKDGIDHAYIVASDGTILKYETSQVIEPETEKETAVESERESEKTSETEKTSEVEREKETTSEKETETERTSETETEKETTSETEITEEISEEDAAYIAMRRAGVTEDEITDLLVESGLLSGKKAYRVSFVKGNEKNILYILADGTVAGREREPLTTETETESEPVSETESETETESESTPETEQNPVESALQDAAERIRDLIRIGQPIQP